jgi:hypothetical protein
MPCLPGLIKPDQLAMKKNIHFWLAKESVMPSLPVPCQESLEKQRPGKPLPNASK